MSYGVVFVVVFGFAGDRHWFRRVMGPFFFLGKVKENEF